jgi:hypothetical protein
MALAAAPKKPASPATNAPATTTSGSPTTRTKGVSFPIRDPVDNTLKTVFHCEEAIPHADGTFTLKRMHMETFREHEQLELIVEAPECRLDVSTRNASSPGSIKVRRADGLFTVEGDGFRWENDRKRLVVSNRVQTVIQQKLLGPAPKKS